MRRLVCTFVVRKNDLNLADRTGFLDRIEAHKMKTLIRIIDWAGVAEIHFKLCPFSHQGHFMVAFFDTAAAHFINFLGAV